MANDQLVKLTEGLEKTDASLLHDAFEGMFLQADKWMRQAKDIVVTDESQKREMKLARESRLALKEIRCTAESTRKRLKADIVSRGRAIDGIFNVLEGLIKPIEAHLLEQETFAKRTEEKRRNELRDARHAALAALGMSTGALASFYSALGEMDDATWNSVRDDAERAKQAREEELRREAEAQAEAERILAVKREEERQKRIKEEAERIARERAMAEENERLRKEAEEREAREAEERRRVEEERAVERRKAQADAEAKELAARAERERAEKAERELAAERERVATEERRRQDEEQRKRDEEARARAQAEAAPDREKLIALANAIRALDVPGLSTVRGKQIGTEAVGRLRKIAARIEEAAETIASSSKEEAAE